MVQLLQDTAILGAAEPLEACRLLGIAEAVTVSCGKTVVGTLNLAP